MSNGKDSIMARAVWLAQLEAAKGTCKCRACQILRKASKVMSDQFLSNNPKSPLGAQPEAEEVLDIEEAEQP